MDLPFALISVEAWFLVALLSSTAFIGYTVGSATRHRVASKRVAVDTFRRLVNKKPAARPVGGGGVDAADQLRAVMDSTYATQRVLSRTEAQVMTAAESAIAEARLDWRVMAQVSLGEVLKTDSKPGFWAINSKRVDLLVMSSDCYPLAAIEYQGSGHHLGANASARDAIKKEALRRAGVAFIEIDGNDGPADVRREIHRLASVLMAKSRPPLGAIRSATA